MTNKWKVKVHSVGVTWNLMQTMRATHTFKFCILFLTECISGFLFWDFESYDLTFFGSIMIPNSILSLGFRFRNLYLRTYGSIIDFDQTRKKLCVFLQYTKDNKEKLSAFFSCKLKTLMPLIRQALPNISRTK